MGSAATVAAIGTAHGSKLITLKMLVTGATMPAAAKYAYLVNEITFLHTLVQQRAKIPCHEGKRCYEIYFIRICFLQPVFAAMPERLRGVFVY